MPHRSRWSVEIPRISLPSFVFESPTTKLPNIPAYIDADRPATHRLSLHAYREWSSRIAAGLLQAGLQQGSRVLVYSGNNMYFPCVFMGVIMAGGIVTTANPTFVARELAYQLKDSEASFLLVAKASLETALEAAKSVNVSQDRIFIFDDEPFQGRGEGIGNVSHWKNLIASPESGKALVWDNCMSVEKSNRTIALLYSSGTTGVPKGVELSHYNFVANGIQVDHLCNLDPRTSRDETNAKQQRLLCFLPMYHGLALIYFAAVAPQRRLPVYIMKRFDLLQMLESIQKFKITELILVPPIIVAMAKHPALKAGKYNLNSVHKIMAGAAPLSREICEELEKLWPKGAMNVKQGWGMTEAPMTILNWDERETSTSSAVGEPIANCEAKIMDDDGINEVSIGHRGELWIRSPNVMKGYWRNPQATKDTLTHDGWLKSGDIAYVDEQGKYFIVDRKKELIKVKGNQVAPAELEALLLEHADVQDAAVIGVKSGEDERPLAYVVKRNGSAITAEQISTFVNGKISKIKRITGGVVFTNLIPKNPVSQTPSPIRIAELDVSIALLRNLKSEISANNKQSGKTLRRTLREHAAAQGYGQRAAVARL